MGTKVLMLVVSAVAGIGVSLCGCDLPLVFGEDGTDSFRYIQSRPQYQPPADRTISLYRTNGPGGYTGVQSIAVGGNAAQSRVGVSTNTSSLLKSALLYKRLMSFARRYHEYLSAGKSSFFSPRAILSRTTSQFCAHSFTIEVRSALFFPQVQT